MDPLDLVTAFASTGRLGPLRGGMTLPDVEALLGPFDSRMPESKPRRWKSRLHFWQDLELLVCHGLVVQIGLPLWRDRLALPPALCGWDAPRPCVLPLRTVTAALDSAGCTWTVAPNLVLGDDNLGLRTTEAGVGLTFVSGRLYTMSKPAFELDQNDHTPRQGRAS
jgi:hypothetical protein